MENSSSSALSPLRGNPFEEDPTTVQGRLFRFILHFFVSTIGVAFAGWIIVARLDVSSSHHHGWFATFIASQYSPAFWIAGFFLGLVINDYMRNRSAQWIGPICFALLLVLVFADVRFFDHSTYYRTVTQGHSWRWEYYQLFSLDNGNCGGSECLGKLLIVPPVLGSIAYSVGAWLALRHKKKKVDASSTS